MLTNIYFEQFKSYEKGFLRLAPLTLMIGANASGKSNALEGFRFLSWLSEGQKLSVLRHRVDDSDKVLRGNINDLPYLNWGSFTLGCDLDESPWNRFRVTVDVRKVDLHISQESISGSDMDAPLYSIVHPSKDEDSDITVVYDDGDSNGEKAQITCTDQIAVMCQLESPAIYNGKRDQVTIPETVKRFQQALTQTLFLDPVPSRMREASSPEKTLRSDCANLSGVLKTLCDDGDYYQKIIHFIRSLPEQDVRSIKFFEYGRGRISFDLVESFGGVDRNCPMELLSDGTLRVLAIAVALFSAPVGSTVVIEEVDNGIHPSRAKQLLGMMKEEAGRRNIRLLLTTHNPALMDALPDESLADVVFCYRDPEKGDSRLIRLADLDDYPGLVVQGSLGGLVTNGVVDRFAKLPVDPESKKQQAMDWISRMQGEET
ncbi:AAA family ATPase [Desulfoluna sp.]|uniref:AAA family ATPase n=1 Tax=Desulfoluna sp. TaxID=2045199 RepID=UPI00260F1F40|nr:ATP-binding protein [Desulfoluna sp.]